MISRYSLEFILSLHSEPIEKVKNSIREFGDGIEITQLPHDGVSEFRDFKVNIHTLDPEVIFDTCGQFGRIKSVKIDESQE